MDVTGIEKLKCKLVPIKTMTKIKTCAQKRIEKGWLTVWPGKGSPFIAQITHALF